ncbi:hypothetical protein [Streptomyces diastatochromogenes]|uniref:hypothetical protein n=1 Tax=Streptomyces diastatochromogenes TaxID=42236 RepID=UPI0036816036
MTFDSYHWKEFSIPDPGLTDHRENLASGHGDQSDFLALLRSGDPVGMGVALDQYSEAEALTRFGSANPFQGHGQAVREVAVRVLEEPPYPSGGEDGEGLNHASALLVLAHLATAEDSDRIAGILRRNMSPVVMNAAGRAARCALMASESLNGNLVDALSGVLLDETKGSRERLDALGAFAYVRDESVGDMLARAARTPDEKLQTEVVVILASHFLATHLDVIEEITAAWSEEPSRTQQRILRAVDAAKRNRTGD